MWIAGSRTADHVDADGEWWAVPGLPQWWVREDYDGTLQARHRTNPRSAEHPDGIADVVVGPGADEPGRLLVAKCGSAVFRAQHPELGGRS